MSQGMARANSCVTYGKPCVHMHANGHAYKMGGQFVEEGWSRKKRRIKNKRERKEIKKEIGEKKERNREKMKSAFQRSELVGIKK